jgi:Undecaprenyl-phosphate glucose phosphotransferase
MPSVFGSIDTPLERPAPFTSAKDHRAATATATAQVELPRDPSDAAVGLVLRATKRGLSAAGAREVLCGLLRAGDALTGILAGFLAHWVVYPSLTVRSEHGLAILLGTVLLMNCFHFAKLYRFDRVRKWRLQLIRTTFAALTVIVFLGAVALALSMRDGRLLHWGTLWLGFILIGVVLNRAIAFAYIARARREGGFDLNIAVIDAGGRGESVGERILVGLGVDARVVGIFRDGNGAPGASTTRQIDELVMLVRLGLVDEVVVACPEISVPAPVLRRLAVLPVDIKLWGDVPRLRRTDPILAGAPMVTVLKRPISGWQWLLKRVEDIVLSGVAILLFGPLLLAVALAIKLDSRGPVIFRQQRFGFSNNEFTVYKFRSMVAGEGDPATPQARRDDPRVTRVGKFLRRTSLDELPQLFNVLKGDMSLVGPRPHAVSHNEHYAALIDGYLARHRVMPGITGWAQVNGLRGETDTLQKMQRRLEHDLYYIDQWSLLFDLRILVKTLFVGFRHHNAY